jgi:hypothetical protein
MAKDQNFDNGSHEWNIHLDDFGELAFKANGKDGDGDTRMVIAETAGQVAIGGSGEFGQLQLWGPNRQNTVFIGGAGTEALALLGGLASGQDGRIKLFDSSGREAVDLDARGGKLELGGEGQDGNLYIYDDAGTAAISLLGSSRLYMRNSTESTVSLDGGTGTLELSDSAGVVVTLSAVSGLLRLGGDSTDGDIEIQDYEGNTTITCNGSTGIITCVDVAEESLAPHGPLRTDIAPLTNALDSVLALRGVRYQRKEVTEPTAAAAGDAQQIGFVGQELEAVCPELVTTDAKGYKSVRYSRVTAVLVEAIKEQQQLIREQAAALGEALQKISTIEADLAAHHGVQPG